jgi:ABC-2 type transport system permease protein
VLSGIQATVRGLAEEFGNDTFAGYAGLISPFSLVDGIVAGPLGGESVMDTPPEGVAMALVYCLLAAVVVVGSYVALLTRYRKALA